MSKIILIILITTIELISSNDPISNLYSNDISKVTTALSEIQRKKITAAIGSIHEILESQINLVPLIRTDMLYTLYFLNDEELNTYIDQYIILSDDFENFDVPFELSQEYALAFSNMLKYLIGENSYIDIEYQYFIENYEADYFFLFLEYLSKALNNNLNEELRYEIFEILVEYGEPIGLKYIIDQQRLETNQIYINLFKYSINEFIPPPFDPELRSLAITEIIQEHIEQLIDFDWCHVEYRNSINQVYFQLSNDQKSEALSTVEYILNMIESDYLNNYITNEGYKFLFYEHTYLYERLLSEL